MKLIISKNEKAKKTIGECLSATFVSQITQIYPKLLDFDGSMVNNSCKITSRITMLHCNVIIYCVRLLNSDRAWIWHDHGCSRKEKRKHQFVRFLRKFSDHVFTTNPQILRKILSKYFGTSYFRDWRWLIYFAYTVFHNLFVLNYKFNYRKLKSFNIASGNSSSSKFRQR